MNAVLRRAKRLALDVRKVARFDVALFHGRKRLLLACLGATLVPALYACIYLSSAWDPYAHVDQLHVAVVNLDEGATARGQPVAVGAGIVEGLTKKRAFQYRDVTDEATARKLVTSGEVAFALVIPGDFSRDAMAARGQAHVRVLFSEGNSFMVSSVARRFAGELAHGTNETLNARRWGAVLETVAGSGESLGRMRAGVAKLRDGAAQLDEGLQQAHGGSTKLAAGLEKAAAGAAKLDDGAHRVAEGTAQLTGGVAKLGAGLRTVRDALPAEEQLGALAAGATQVAQGQQQLTAGLERLADGEARARDGARELKERTAGLPIVGAQVSGGAAKLESGLATLTDGALKARDGSRALADGAGKVADGTQKLTTGVSKLGGGVRQMAERIPDDATLNQLSGGATQVADGAHALHQGTAALAHGAGQLDEGLGKLSDGAGRLHDGLDTLAAAIPASVDGLDGDASGLAASVEPQLESLTTAGAYGNSLAPFLMGMSLWVGVVMMGFIFQLRWFPQRVRSVRRAALVLGRMAVPVVLVFTQATLLTLALRFVLHVQLASFWSAWLVAVVTSVTFLSVLLMLIGLFGDAGKVVALLFLVFQMGASGGMFPRELMSPVFAALHPWVPFSWVVRAGRAAMFGAFDGAWLPALGMVALFCVASVAIASVLGRWKFVARHRFVPLLDV